MKTANVDTATASAQKICCMLPLRDKCVNEVSRGTGERKIVPNMARMAPVYRCRSDLRRDTSPLLALHRYEVLARLSDADRTPCDHRVFTKHLFRVAKTAFMPSTGIRSLSAPRSVIFMLDKASNASRVRRST